MILGRKVVKREEIHTKITLRILPEQRTNRIMADYNIEFFFDPVCPFAWITSRWIVDVAEQKDFTINWRFISLKILNADRASETPEKYLNAQNRGMELLRVAAAAKPKVGAEAIGRFYTEAGTLIHTIEHDDAFFDTPINPIPLLKKAEIPLEYAESATDSTLDEKIVMETQEALQRTGENLGTPIITFHPPNGASFFGPVISKKPSYEHAVPLWDAVTTLAEWPSFAELKRSIREAPQTK